jgi:hypothetical protein
VHVERPGITFRDVVIKNAGELFSGNRLSFFFEKKLRHFVFAWRQIDQIAFFLQDVVFQIQSQRTDGDRLHRFIAAGMGVDPGHQFHEIKGLFNVIIRSEIQPIDLIHNHGPGRNDDDLDVIVGVVFADFFEDVFALNAREHHIKKNHVGFAFRKVIQKAFPIGVGLDLISLFGQSGIDDVGNIRIVFNGIDQKDDAFFQDIQFGTGGMRGILGPGTNRMNTFTVKRATIAMGEMVLKQYPNAKKQGIVISHDNRHHSRDYAEECAQILNEMGINAYLFDSLRPTPELSYGVRYVKGVGGIMITASHNPKQYNGYKVYDDKGCQLVPEKIQPMLDILASLPDPLEVETPKASRPGKTDHPPEQSR